MESVYEGSKGKGLFNFEGNGRCFLSCLIGECMQANTGQGIKTYFLKVGSCDFFFSTFFTFSTMTTELLSTEFLQKMWGLLVKQKVKVSFQDVDLHSNELK